MVTVKEIMVDVFGIENAERLLSFIPFDEDGCREINVKEKHRTGDIFAESAYL